MAKAVFTTSSSVQSRSWLVHGRAGCLEMLELIMARSGVCPGGIIYSSGNTLPCPYDVHRIRFILASDEMDANTTYVVWFHLPPAATTASYPEHIETKC